MIILRVLARRLRIVTWVGFLLLSVSASANPPAESSAIVVLGDSISAAYGMALEEGWVALLAARIDQERMPYKIINASISGETSAGGLRRLPALLQTHQPGLVIIELGGNDGLRGYPIGQLQSNLREMIKLSEQADAQVLLLPMEIPPNFGKFYADAFRDSFRNAIEGNQAVLGDFPLRDVALKSSLMQNDGIHPTAVAQPIILESVWQNLSQLLP